MAYKENAEFYYAKNFFRGYPFEVITIKDKVFTQQLHCHDYFQLWYVKKGECSHYFNDKEYVMKKGELFVMPPDAPHKICCKDDENTELISCGFLRCLIEDSLDNESGFLKVFNVKNEFINPRITLQGMEIKKVEELLSEIIYEYENKNEYFELHIKSDIFKILSIAARANIKNSGNTKRKKAYRHKEKISEVISYMKEHCREKIYIQDVCGLVGMSPTYFSYIFKQVTGNTFSEYMRILKIECAKELLLNNTKNKTIGEIAVELGFDDHAYFDRVFKKEAGISPKDFINFYKYF